MVLGDERLTIDKRHNLVVKSSFVVALITFLSINFYLSFFSPLTFDQFKFPYRGWAWWAINDLKSSGSVHNVALLGSSLMVSAIATCDANYLRKSLDLSAYHGAAYLDHKFRTKYGGQFNTFNLSLPGQVPSDAYFALRAMVNCSHRPDVVIYGVAPRDFLDSTLSSPVDTDAFRYFRRLVNLDDVSNALFRSPLAKLNWWLEKEIFLLGSSLDFQLSFVEATSHLLDAILPKPADGKPFTFWDRAKLLPTYLPAELYPGAVMIHAVSPDDKPHRPLDNTYEYRLRYRAPDFLTYKIQMYFLKKIVEFCLKERIELVVVNMPITAYNVLLMSPGAYPQFVQAVRTVCFENGVTFFDLCEFDRYYWCDYNDSVHMNGFGGHKFVDRLVECLGQDGRVSGAMTLAGAELERAILANSHKTGAL